MIYVDLLESPIGKLYIKVDDDKLVGISYKRSQLNPSKTTEKIKKELEKYFSGSLKKFSCKIDFIDGTPFYHKVWRYLAHIPYGEVVSYKDIAIILKTSPRAIGNAMAKNPIPIILPCHRVISNNGKLGGFSLGLNKKIKLLEIENIDLFR